MSGRCAMAGCGRLNERERWRTDLRRAPGGRREPAGVIVIVVARVSSSNPSQGARARRVRARTSETYELVHGGADHVLGNDNGARDAKDGAVARLAVFVADLWRAGDGQASQSGMV